MESQHATDSCRHVASLGCEGLITYKQLTIYEMKVLSCNTTIATMYRKLQIINVFADLPAAIREVRGLGAVISQPVQYFLANPHISCTSMIATVRRPG